MLKVNNLSKEYIIKSKREKKRIVKAVDNVSFILEDNKNYALVGESGSGKSTLASLLCYLEKPSSGEIIFDNKNITEMNKRDLRKKRADFQLVSQDSKSALDPRLKVYDSIAEPIRNFLKLAKRKERLLIESLLEKVELSLEFINRYPYQLSGGQQKRICIARAISINPKLIIFDEAVSSLDLTSRKKIVDLLLNLREGIESSYLFITHDIDLAIYVARNIIVMNQGKIVEKIESMKSLSDFQNQYSLSLINSLLPRAPVRRLERL